MDGNPAPDGRGTVEGRQAASPDEPREDSQGENFGPLSVRRLTKDDGRSLIVYGRRGAA